MNKEVEKEINEMLSLIERIEKTPSSKGENNLLEKKSDIYTFEEDELMEYTYISKKVSGLPVDCFADDGGSYQMRGHDMWFLFRNSYNRDTNDVIPIIVSAHPKVAMHYKTKLSVSDVSKILEYVAINYDVLIGLANDKLTHGEFFERLKPLSAVVEDTITTKGILDEMSYIRPSVTGLPMVIWVDEGQTHFQSGHSGSERIKFQYVQGQKHSKNFASMTLSKTPQVITPLNNSDISSEDIKLLENFVKRYYELLRAVSREKISVTDFETLLIKSKTLNDEELSLFKQQIETAIANGTINKIIQRIKEENNITK